MLLHQNMFATLPAWDTRYQTPSTTSPPVLGRANLCVAFGKHKTKHLNWQGSWTKCNKLIHQSINWLEGNTSYNKASKRNKNECTQNLYCWWTRERQTSSGHLHSFLNGKWNYQRVFYAHFSLPYNKEFQSAATHLKDYFKKCYSLATSPPPAQWSLFSSANYWFAGNSDYSKTKPLLTA